jgi:hypothetical protein
METWSIMARAYARGVRRIIGLVVVLAILGLLGYVGWYRWMREAGPANPGFNCPTVVAARHRLPFSADGVHRVALIGDSIMDQASCAIAGGLANVGIESSRHGIWGSGLLVGSDWVARARAIVDAEHPDAVIAVFNGNYLFGTVNDARGKPIEPGTPAFFHAWQQRAEALSAVVHAGHAQMYWVSPPPIAVTDLKANEQLFQGYRTIHGDHVLLSGRVLTGPHGTVITSKETCGHRAVIRAKDGIHLTADGARLYGQQIAHDFTADIGLLTAPKPC